MAKDEKKTKHPISDVLKKLLEPQEVVVSRYKTQEALKDAIIRGFFLIRFTKMFGGSELGVTLKDSPFKDLTKWNEDSVTVCGKLEFQGVPTKFKATFNLNTLEGQGCLEIID